LPLNTLDREKPEAIIPFGLSLPSLTKNARSPLMIFLWIRMTSVYRENLSFDTPQY